jgi:MFS transporter, DHA1 family, inner membrane transport protein
VRSRLLLTVYGLILVGELMWSAMVPLVPAFARELHLSTFATGVLVSGTGAAVLVVSVPAGILADRVGARRVAVAATAFLAVGLAGHALPPTFAGLFASRVVFGIGFGALWTAGVALAGDLVPPERRARALALPMTIAGVAFMLGPAVAGIAAAHVGPRLPFAVGAVAVAVLGASLAVGRVPAVPRGPAREPITLGRLRRATRVQVGLACTLVAGFTASAVFLVVPLQLADEGMGTAAIGVALTASAVGFTLLSTVVAKAGARAATATVGAIAMVALAGPMVLPVVAAGAIPLIVLLVLRGPVTAVLFGISYPLCVEGADEAGLGRGAILGLLNMTWAASAVVGPVVAGGLAQAGGDRLVYVALIAVCLAVAPWILLRRHAVRAPVPASAPAGA